MGVNVKVTFGTEVFVANGVEVFVGVDVKVRTGVAVGVFVLVGVAEGDDCTLRVGEADERGVNVETGVNV